MIDFNHNPYEFCTDEEEFDRTRRLINLIIWITLPSLNPIVSQK